MRKNQKGIIIVPILIIVVLIGVVGFFIYQNRQLKQEATQTQPVSNPTSNPTSDTPSPIIDLTVDWETFENKEFGLQFRYPSGWNIKEDAFASKPNLKTVMMISPDKKAFVDVWLFRESGLNKFKEEAIKETDQWEDISINNMPCIVNSIDRNNKLYACGFTGASKYIQIVYSSDYSLSPRNTEMLNIILTTFKLTN